ncbi:MAG TPA: permease prefix domain 1-containing protein [Actinomycetota bacterium]|nr:permease prefix domain 1-containing protein [Actinomycetota bacterium]
MSDPITCYLADLEAQGAAGRTDTARLREEAEDHLREAATRYVEMGLAPDEAAGRAVVDFGDAGSILSEVPHRKGKDMKLRYLAGGLAMISLSGLSFGHITSSGDVVNSAHEPIALAGFAGMVLAGALLALAASAAASLILLLVGGGTYWALSTDATGDLGLYVVSAGHFGSLAAAAFVAWGIARLLGARGATGIGLVAGGVTSLLLNGAHEPLGGLGDGQANLGIAAIGTGWALILVTNLAPRLVNRMRGFVARFLLGLSRKLEPVSQP